MPRVSTPAAHHRRERRRQPAATTRRADPERRRRRSRRRRGTTDISRTPARPLSRALHPRSHPGHRPDWRTSVPVSAAMSPVPSSTKVSRRRGCARESQPNLADIAPRLPAAPCVGPLRIEMYWRLPIGKADRRAERGRRGIERPHAATLGGGIRRDVAVGLPLEDEIAGGGQHAAAVRALRGHGPRRPLLHGIPGEQRALAGVRRRVAVRIRLPATRWSAGRPGRSSD